jgi:hypothetical protein
MCPHPVEKGVWYTHASLISRWTGLERVGEDTFGLRAYAKEKTTYYLRKVFEDGWEEYLELFKTV